MRMIKREKKIRQKQVSNIMNQGMELVDLFVNKNYLIDVDKCDPIPLNEADKTFSAMSLYQIDKIVYDLNENINDKLVSVYSALSNFGSSVVWAGSRTSVSGSWTKDAKSFSAAALSDRTNLEPL